ncbi:MAG: OmpA family protein [Gammaproteobacteria bacterium]
MKQLTTFIALTAAAFMHPAWSAATCNEEAQSLYQLGEKAYDDGRDEDAARFYSQAAGECNNYDYWMDAANVWVEDILAGTSPTNVRENGGTAVRALQNAYASAETNEQRVTASKGMIELGLMSDDPLNARNWLVHTTQELGASEASVADLRARIELKEANLTAGQISRGSGKGGALLFDPVQLSGPALGSDIGPREVGAAGGVDMEDEVSAATSEGVVANTTPAAPVKKGPQTLNIPIKFERNSTEPTADTMGNLVAMAEVLVNDYPDARFSFIGHADARGDANYNLNLSIKRAEQVRDLVEADYPALAGRITATGKGEAEPREQGSSEAAYHSNRRLEVFIEE